MPPENPASIPVGNRAIIIPGSPMPEYDSVGGRAFSAQYKDGAATTDLLGILCDRSLQIRADMLTAVRGVDQPAVLRLIDSGVVNWVDGKRYYAFAYQRPLTTRLKTSIDEPHQPMGDDFLTNHFIKPMISALIEFQRCGVVHHSIRPTNIFWRIGATTVPQLGDYLSTPPGLHQPVLFEPLERAMSAPAGRGIGHHADDCYAFGVTLALMILGTNPMQGMDDAAIIRAKLDRGSFSALVGNRRISPAHIEILRGLLADDLRQRWTSSDLQQWTSGRRLTPKNTDIGKRAARAYSFAGQDFWQTRPLAHAMASNVAEAAKIIESGALDKWLRRSVNDDVRAANLAQAMASLKQSGKIANYEDQLVTRAVMAIDPAGPIRYRGVSVMPMGIAPLLAETVINGGAVQPIGEIISSQLPTLWVDFQQDIKTEMVPVSQQLERMKGLIEKTSLGNGVERVVYEINPGLPCLSGIVRGQYVTNGRAMLNALEKIAASGDRGQEPIDRHIAAFLLVREKRADSLFEQISAPGGSITHGLGLLILYADLQDKHGPDALPALAQWLAPALEPILQRFLGKNIKDKLRQQLKDAITRGSLASILRLVDDPHRVQRDQQEFMSARMLYLNILKEIAHLEGRIASRDDIVNKSGKPLAASISTMIAIVLVFVAILRAAWNEMFASYF